MNIVGGRAKRFGALHLEITMEDSSTALPSAGILICVTTLCLTFFLSCLAIKSRSRVSQRGSRSTDHANQHTPANKPPKGFLTKDWVCSACNRYSRPKEVSSGGSDLEEDPCDLEIQHTLGSLAISQTSFPETRVSPNSWLHLIEDLNLLPEKTSHKQRHSDPHVGNDGHDSVVKNHSIAQPSTVESSAAVTGTLSDRYTTKPLIQPARLQLRKRRFSISSATAALSLAGNGWSLGSDMTEKTNGHVTNSGRCANPFLNCEYLSNKRNSSPNLQHQFVSIHEKRCDDLVVNSRSQLTESNRLKSQGLKSTPPKENQNLSEFDLSEKTIRSHHCLRSSPALDNQHQPQPTGLSRSDIHGNQAPPPGKGVSCPLVALVIFSLTTNVVLLLVLFVYVYKPNFVVPVNL